MNAKEKRDILLPEFIRILFYEQTHLAIYDAQSKRISDCRIAAFMERFKHLEEEHVAKMKLVIGKLGGHPTLLNQVAPLAGYVGTALLAADTRKVLLFNLTLESKAVHGYTKPIRMAESLGSGISDYLRENQCEAEMMGLWLQEELTRFGGAGDDRAIKADFYGDASDDY